MKSKDAWQIVQLVNGLSHKGVQISKCTEEKRKYKRLMDELKDCSILLRYRSVGKEVSKGSYGFRALFIFLGLRDSKLKSPLARAMADTISRLRVLSEKQR